MVRVERNDGVEVITLDRPERRNAVDHPTLLELLEIQDRLASDAISSVRAVVLCGASPAFSAGADLNGVEEGTFTTDLGRVLRAFGELPVPVIASIDGPALGAGTQLVVACDLRIATPESVLGIPAARLGLAVDLWTIDSVEREFGSSVAHAMLIGGETYTAERLHAIGGIHRLGDLADAVEWAQRLASMAPLTMRAHKSALRVGRDEPDRVERYEELRTGAWASADAEEGRTAFLEKRRPTFTGT